MPSAIQHTYFNAPEPTPLLCKFYAFSATIGTAVIAYSYLVQAISRFFITILYKHKFLLTFRTNWILIITSWIISVFIGGGMFISPTAYQYEPESQFCTLTTNNFLTSLLASTVMGVLIMVIMTILYGIILYHTMQHNRINPNSATALRAKRNEKVFKRIFNSISIFGIGGTPYLFCVILNRVGRTLWPLYSIAFLVISFVSAINSIVLLITNDQVKEILLTKLTDRRANVPNITRTTKRNQIAPQPMQMRSLPPLPMIS